MYTYAGDANLDGKVNGDDYFQIDCSFTSPARLTASTGDFNYDGKINGDDYFLIDRSHSSGRDERRYRSRPAAGRCVGGARARFARPPAAQRLDAPASPPQCE